MASPQALLKKDVLDLARTTAAELDASVDPSSILVDDRYVGPGYAVRTPGCEQAAAMFARRLGIFLDYVYTGKAAALIDYLRKGRSPEVQACFLFTPVVILSFSNKSPPVAAG